MTMKLEDQVTSLELSKKLKELGFKQESLFYWATTQLDLDKDFSLYIGEQITYIDKTQVYEDSGSEGDYWDINEAYSAFTVAEILDMLPMGVMLIKGSHGYISGDGSKLPYYQTIDDNPASVLAKMLIGIKDKHEKVTCKCHCHYTNKDTHCWHCVNIPETCSCCCHLDSSTREHKEHHMFDCSHCKKEEKSKQV